MFVVGGLEIEKSKEKEDLSILTISGFAPSPHFGRGLGEGVKESEG